MTTVQDEIDKVKSRVPRWFSNPQQINSQILLQYLKLNNQTISVSYDRLKHECSHLKTFKTNFDQLRNFGEKNHGKVFEECNGKVTLWEPVRQFVLDEYKKTLLTGANTVTTLAVDDYLLNEAVLLGHHKSTQEAVVKALELYIQYLKEQEILEP